MRRLHLLPISSPLMSLLLFSRLVSFRLVSSRRRIAPFVRRVEAQWLAFVVAEVASDSASVSVAELRTIVDRCWSIAHSHAARVSSFRSSDELVISCAHRREPEGPQLPRSLLPGRSAATQRRSHTVRIARIAALSFSPLPTLSINSLDFLVRPLRMSLMWLSG